MSVPSKPQAALPLMSADPRYQAVMARDATWDGAFVFAVTSTRIYCKPSCPARRPRTERMRLFDNSMLAAAEGFRACKRCKPDEVARNTHRELVARTVAALHADSNASLEQLAAAAGVSRAHLQRTFSNILGVSPLEFATQLRAARMRNALGDGETVSQAAFGAGFESLQSAYAAADRHIGMSPGAYRRGAPGITIRYAIATCALGTTLVAITERGVCRVLLGGNAEELEAEFRNEFAEATLLPIDAREDVLLAEAVRVVLELAAGRATDVRVPLDLAGTAFQQRVWKELTRIARGETVTYGELAARIGAPAAVRAVGTACGANPVALLVPCHRVLRSDGALGGYRWGLERKERLVQAEREG